jgi:cytidylate kinase
VKDSSVVIAIDGPGSSGKGTLGMLLAGKLGCTFVDTGAMYRALAVEALRRGLSPDDEKPLADLARQSKIRFSPSPDGDSWPFRITIDGNDVTEQIRTPRIDMASSRISAYPAVHQIMVEKQRELARQGGVVMEGRDIGTVVVPDADVKFFLTASVEERARRRYRQMQGWGREADLGRLEEQLSRRDENDSRRQVAPLRQAEDAVVIDTTELSIDQVLERMLQHLPSAASAGDTEG